MKHHLLIEQVHDSDPSSGYGLKGDYVGVRISSNGKVIRIYGDADHENGLQKAQGFIDGFKAALALDHTVTLEMKQVAEDGLV